MNQITNNYQTHKQQISKETNQSYILLSIAIFLSLAFAGDRYFYKNSLIEAIGFTLIAVISTFFIYLTKKEQEFRLADLEAKGEPQELTQRPLYQRNQSFRQLAWCYLSFFLLIDLIVTILIISTWPQLAIWQRATALTGLTVPLVICGWWIYQLIAYKYKQKKPRWANN